MPIIWPCPLSPCSYAAGGRGLAVPAQACPNCRRSLTGWGGYWRWMRAERRPAQRIWIPRRWCARCAQAWALLPSFLLVRRLDVVAVIGAALEQGVAGNGARPIAQRLELPHSTVRGWWRRLKTKAPMLVGSLLTLATSLDPAPVDLRMDGTSAVLEALDHTWERARARLGARLPDRWGFWSLISGGLALAPHTSPPLPGGAAAGVMTAAH